MQALRMLLIYQQFTAHVANGDVVLRIVRPFPYVERVGGVEYCLSTQRGADPAGNRLDVVDGDDHRGVVAHVFSFGMYDRYTGEPDWFRSTRNIWMRTVATISLASLSAASVD